MYYGAEQLNKIANDIYWSDKYNYAHVLESSMLAEAEKGKYYYRTINRLDDDIVFILKQLGYKVNLVNYPPGSNGYCHEISWVK